MRIVWRANGKAQQSNFEAHTKLARLSYVSLLHHYIAHSSFCFLVMFPVPRTTYDQQVFSQKDPKEGVGNKIPVFHGTTYQYPKVEVWAKSWTERMWLSLLTVYMYILECTLQKYLNSQVARTVDIPGPSHVQRTRLPWSGFNVCDAVIKNLGFKITKTKSVLITKIGIYSYMVQIFMHYVPVVLSTMKLWIFNFFRAILTYTMHGMIVTNNFVNPVLQQHHALQDYTCT